MRKLRPVRERVLQHLAPPDDRLTLAEHLDDWLAELEGGDLVRPRTVERYRGTIERHIIPALGRVPLTKLTRAQVQNLINAKHREGLTRVPAYIKAVLRIALNHAMRDGRVYQNVAALTRLPKRERREIRPLTVAETNAFFDSLEATPERAADRNRALYMVAAFGGLRKGELLGLQWNDVDLDEGALTVRVQAQRINGVKQLVPPKTAESRRTVYLPIFVLAALREHRLCQLKERHEAGDRWQESGLVFPSTTGTIADSANVTHAFHNALKRAGLPRARFHDLRHLAASLMVSQGVNPKDIQSVLGHSQLATTMDLYSHVMDENKREVARRLATLRP